MDIFRYVASGQTSNHLNYLVEIWIGFWRSCTRCRSPYQFPFSYKTI